MRKNFLEAVIIGSSKIAQIHYNYIRQNNIKKFYFVGRNKKKIDQFIKKNKIYDASFLDKKYLNNSSRIISVCNKTDFHQDYLNYIKHTNQLIIIEKPLISVKIFNDNYLNKIKSYYKKFRKLAVVYPMLYLAKSYESFVKNRKIKEIKIYYFTKGNHSFDDIYIDLLPHCLIFFKELCRLKKKKIGPLININKQIFKFNNNIQLTFQNVKLDIFLKEKYKGKNSKFYFTVNKSKYFRKTHLVNGNFKNFIKFQDKLFEIDNPMRQFFFHTFNNLNKKKYFIDNRKLSIWLSKMTFKIFNN